MITLPQPVIDRLRALATDGHMPSQKTYNSDRPRGLPAVKTLVTNYGSWSAVAALAGLECVKYNGEVPAETLQRAYDHLRALAAQTRRTPSRVTYERTRLPGLPVANTLVARHGSWSAVILAADLAPNRPRRDSTAPDAPASDPTAPDPVQLLHPAPVRFDNAAPPLVAPVAAPVVAPVAAPPRPPAIAAQAEARRNRLNTILAALRALATDGHMPSIPDWDRHRPSGLPRAANLLDLYVIPDWAALAKLADLKPTKRHAAR